MAMPPLAGGLSAGEGAGASESSPTTLDGFGVRPDGAVPASAPSTSLLEFQPIGPYRPDADEPHVYFMREESPWELWDPPAPRAPQVAEPQREAPAASGRTALVAALLGILTLAAFWAPALAVLLGLAAIVLGCVALRRHGHRGVSAAAIATGALGIVVTMAISVVGTVPPPDEVIGGVEYSHLDPAAYADLLADPSAHYGENVILFASVDDFDPTIDPCGLYLTVDRTQQSRWEDYVGPAWGWAASRFDPGAACDEFGHLELYSHVKVYARVMGLIEAESDSSIEEMLELEVFLAEELGPLPQG